MTKRPSVYMASTILLFSCKGTTTSQKKEGEILQYEWEINPSEERGKPSITRGSSTTLTCSN